MRDHTSEVFFFFVYMSPDSRSASIPRCIASVLVRALSIRVPGGVGEGSSSCSTILPPKPQGSPPYSWEWLRADLRLSFKLSCAGKNGRPIRRFQGDTDSAVVGVAMSDDPVIEVLSRLLFLQSGAERLIYSLKLWATLQPLVFYKPANDVLVINHRPSLQIFQWESPSRPGLN